MKTNNMKRVSEKHGNSDTLTNEYMFANIYTKKSSKILVC